MHQLHPLPGIRQPTAGSTALERRSGLRSSCRRAGWTIALGHRRAGGACGAADVAPALLPAPQDDTPFDVLLEPLAPAAGLEVLRINRCMGLQLTIEGEAPRSARWCGAGARTPPGAR